MNKVCVFVCVVLKGDLLAWLTGCGLGSPTMTVLSWKNPRSASCSVLEAGRSSNPNLAQES